MKDANRGDAVAGPWTVWSTNIGLIVKDGEDAVACVYTPHNLAGKVPRRTLAEADAIASARAALIAAAPDLLAALVACVESLVDAGRDHAPSVAAARAAIAAATDSPE